MESISISAKASSSSELLGSIFISILRLWYRRHFSSLSKLSWRDFDFEQKCTQNYVQAGASYTKSFFSSCNWENHNAKSNSVSLQAKVHGLLQKSMIKVNRLLKSQGSKVLDFSQKSRVGFRPKKSIYQKSRQKSMKKLFLP